MKTQESFTIQPYPTVLIFLVADFVSFLLFFLVFMMERMKRPEEFRGSAASLNIGIGVTNTLLLLTSGWLVAMAVSACSANDRPRARALLLGGIFAAVGFILLKAVEYHQKYIAGVGISTNAFFSFYYVLTGLHLVHVIAGLTVLILMWRWIGHDSDNSLLKSKVITGGLYWHLVDLLWIFLFPLLYLQVS